MSWIAAKELAARFWPLAVGLLLVALLLLAYCEGKDSGTNEADKARLEDNVKAGEAKGKADEKAADTRVNDTVRAERERAELKEAVEDAKASGRDPRAAYYECIRLQQAARAGGRAAPACG